MAVDNRALDASEQKKNIQFQAGALATGVTGIIANIPFPCALNAIQVAAFGLSGAPNLAVVVNRFIVGTGSTAITVAVGTSNVLPAYGTSGVPTLGMLISASFVLLPNDVVMYLTGVSSTAVTGLAGVMVVQPLQDVKTFCGNLA